MHASSAEALERDLGDPRDPVNALNFESMAALDERDEYPQAACDELDRWGLPDYYVPGWLGGKLHGFDELLGLLRVLARRDLTVAIAHGKTLLGSICIWVGGSPTQQARAAEIIRAGGQAALALTERGHGSDFLATETTLSPRGDGFVLNGEKWLVNNATRSRVLTVLARSSTATGPRSLSLVLFDKSRVPAGSFQHLPRIRTLGIRGADISGIRFEDAPVPADAVIGTVGTGLETVLKGLQVTRILCAGLSLGALESALRLTLRFACSRRLYGDVIIHLPLVRRALAEAFLDLIACECMTVAATRTLHAAPAQASVVSAAVKFLVPTMVEAAIARLARVLGARHYLRDEFEWGAFQKCLRDNAIVSLFDGSTVVNLQALGAQLPTLSRASHRARAGEADVERLRQIFDLGLSLPAFAPSRLSITNRGENDHMSGLRRLERDLDATPPPADGADEETARSIRSRLGPLLAAVEAHAARVRRLEEERGGDLARSSELFDLAEEYARYQMAAACFQVWHASAAGASRFFRRGSWLALCLERIVPGMQPAADELRRGQVAAVFDELLARQQQNTAFSAFPYPLAPASCEPGREELAR